MSYATIHKPHMFWAGSIFITVGILLLSPTGLYFLNDDLIHIPLSSKGVFLQRHSWRPIGDFSIMLDWFVWRKNAWGYHLSCLLLHCISACLVGTFVNTLCKQYMPAMPQQVLVAWLSAVLFFVYAFHSEAVFWIIGRSASLAMVFALPAFIFYLHRHIGKRFIWLSAVCFQMAMLAYESVWVFPVFAVIFSAVTVYTYRSKWKPELFYVTLIWASFIIHVAVRFIYLGELTGNYEASHFKALNLTVLSSNFIKLLLRTFLPPAQQSWQLLGGAAALIIIVWVVIYRSRRVNTAVRIPVIAGLCLLISYLPYLSLGIDTHGVESERFLYMPSVFATLLLAWSIVFVFARFALPVFITVAAYHLVFLNVSRTCFLQAGKVSRAAFTQVNLLSNKKRLFIDSLPDEIRGALIFRLGFREGTTWLKNDGTVDTIIVLSRKLNDIGNENFNDKEAEIKLNPNNKMPNRLQQHRYGSTTATYVADTSFLYNAVQDAYFKYENGKWLIWK